jgi:hypothetical protein
MPKKIFWPITLVIMGLIFMASNLGYLPTRFWNLWPIILVVVGLGGLLTSDRDDWLSGNKTTRRASKRSTKKTARRSTKRKTKKRK